MIHVLGKRLPGDLYMLENNMTLQDQLYALRSETQATFDEAKSLESRWAEIEKEQKEVFQVASLSVPSSPSI